MNQRELNRAVSRATGESMNVISRMGFSQLDPNPIDRDPLTVDWDVIQGVERSPFARPRIRRSRRAAA
jgi:hypothetical protein